MSNYGAILKEARAASGLTMENVRDHLVATVPDITPTMKTLWNYHSADHCSHRPDSFLLMVLADLYNIDASALLGRSFDAMQEIAARSRCFTVSAGHGP